MKKIFGKTNISVLAGSALVALVTLAAFTGCSKKESTAQAGGTSSSGSSGNDGFITIKSAFATGMTGSVNNFAIETGLYEKEGIRFDNIQRTNDMLALISRGEVDVADGDPSTYIPAIYNGIEAKLVGNMWRYSGCFWIIAHNDIQKPEDLRGKTIGTAVSAGGMKLTVLKYLENYGISTDDVKLVANSSYQPAYATFTSGEVDATVIHNPYAALSEAEGTGHPLARAWDIIPEYYTGTIIASNKFIKQHPDQLQRFITAYYKVHEEVKHNHFDEFVAWAAKNMNTDEEVMRKAILSEIDVWLDYPVIPEERLYRTIGFQKEYGWVGDEIKVEGTFDNTFAKKAAEELGLKDPYAK